jgi:His-Xaa-Ser system protein HxsD
MELDVEPAERTVAFEVPEKIYSRQGLEIAAQIFSSKADVYLGKTGGVFEVTLKSKRKTAAAEGDLEVLAGEFVNELLNQEYRFIVGRFNQKISSFIVTQTLLSARGGETPAEIPAEEKTPEFKARVAALMKAASAEVAKTMPPKIPHQGTPLPPVKEDASA